MRNGGFTGWAAALLLALLSGFLLIRLQERTGELANLRAEMGRLQAAAQETATSLESLRAAVDQIQKQAAPPAGAADSAPAPAATPAVAGEKPAAERPDLTKLLSKLGSRRAVTGAVTVVSGEGLSGTSSPDMSEELVFETPLEELAEMDVLRKYDPWIEEMVLPPALEERVRALFLEYEIAERKAFRDSDASGVVELLSDDVLRKQLAGVLSPEAMASYDKYMEDLPARMREEDVDMELTFEARGLSPEGKELYKTVLLEEERAMEQGFEFAVEGEEDINALIEAHMEEHMEQHMDTYGRALERVRANLSARDLRILENLVERNRRMYDAFQNVTLSDEAPKPE